MDHPIKQYPLAGDHWSYWLIRRQCEHLNSFAKRGKKWHWVFCARRKRFVMFYTKPRINRGFSNQHLANRILL